MRELQTSGLVDVGQHESCYL